MAETEKKEDSTKRSGQEPLEVETLMPRSSSDSHSWIFNVKSYTLLMSLIYACCSAGTAIIIGTVTTLQRAFGFSSTQIGMIQASYSIGYAGSILFVSHFAEKSHKPRWVSAGAVAVAISCFLPLIPHFFIWLPAHRELFHLTSRSSLENVDAVILERGLCIIGESDSTSSGCPSSPEEQAFGGSTSTSSHSNGDENQIAYVLFAFASIFAGLGNSPLNTVGMTYIDDNVSKQDSAFYMGIPLSMFAVGPVLGFFFHAYIMQFHADVFMYDISTGENVTTSFTTIERNSKHFVGAWWISYLIIGCTIFCLAVVALAFPRHLKTRRRGEDLCKDKGDGFRKSADTWEKGEEEEEAVKFKNGALDDVNGPQAERVDPVVKTSPMKMWLRVKSLLVALFDLLSNPVYCATLIGSACFSTGMTGLFYFFPKIIEHQFGVSTIVSNVCYGIVEIPVGLGMFFGGYFIKRFKFSPRGAALFTPIFQAIGVVTVVIMLFVRCQPDQYASFSGGGGRGSPTSVSSSSSFSLTKGVFKNLSSDCNSACRCSHDDFQPVCGDGRVNYLNPCHAGCTASRSVIDNDNDGKIYTNCSCTLSNTARPGPCVTVPLPDSTLPPFIPCPQLVGYIVVFLVAMLAFFLTRMTIINVCIRSAGDERRGLALGLRSFLGNIMGNFTSSVLFGVIIDDACVLWRDQLDELASASLVGDSDCVVPGGGRGGGGDCLIYDPTRFHFLTHGFAGILDLIGVGFFFLAYFLARKQPWAADQGAIKNSSTTMTATTPETAEKNTDEIA